MCPLLSSATSRQRSVGDEPLGAPHAKGMTDIPWGPVASTWGDLVPELPPLAPPSEPEQDPDPEEDPDPDYEEEPDSGSDVSGGGGELAHPAIRARRRACRVRSARGH